MKVKYVGQPTLTRGEFGERVDFGHIGRFDWNDNFVEAANGDRVAVWDATFGWQDWGAWPDHPDFEEDR